MSYFPPVAGVASESFTPPTDNLGTSDIETRRVTAKSGEAWSYLQVLGRITASGKFVKHAPAATDGSEVAVALAAYAVPTLAADTTVSVIVEGEFDIAGCTFDASITTDAAKLAVFDPITSQIKLTARAFGSI